MALEKTLRKSVPKTGADGIHLLIKDIKKTLVHSACDDCTKPRHPPPGMVELEALDGVEGAFGGFNRITYHCSEGPKSGGLDFTIKSWCIPGVQW